MNKEAVFWRDGWGFLAVKPWDVRLSMIHCRALADWPTWGDKNRGNASSGSKLHLTHPAGNTCEQQHGPDNRDICLLCFSLSRHFLKYVTNETQGDVTSATTLRVRSQPAPPVGPVVSKRPLPSPADRTLWQPWRIKNCVPFMSLWAGLHRWIDEGKSCRPDNWWSLRTHAFFLNKQYNEVALQIYLTKKNYYYFL